MASKEHTPKRHEVRRPGKEEREGDYEIKYLFSVSRQNTLSPKRQNCPTFFLLIAIFSTSPFHFNGCDHRQRIPITPLKHNS